eukprot:1170198-Prymnesium_polylepis.1
MDELGELHPPKDPDRRQILLPPEEVTEIRQIVLTDVMRLADAGASLSPGWFRQLGIWRRWRDGDGGARGEPGGDPQRAAGGGAAAAG